MITTTGFIKKLDKQLNMLELDTAANPYSGLMTSVVQGDLGLVEIYDDYDRGYYGVEALAEALEDLDECSLEQFWALAAEFEATHPNDESENA